MKLNLAKTLLIIRRSGIFLFASLLLLMSAPRLMAENSPNNGAYYDVKQGVVYYEFKKADNSTRYDRYVVVDADYTDSLVIEDYINDLPVDYVYNMANRSDIEYLSIGSQVRYADFRGCSYLTEVDLSRIQKTGANINISYTAVEKLVVPAITLDANSCESLTEVIFTGKGSANFNYCNKLSTITLHEDMTACPSCKNCVELQSIVLPAGITTLQNDCFNGCSKLASVTFANGSQLKTIGDYAFCGTAVKQFDCPDGVETIGTRAFAYTPIEEFKMPASITTRSKTPGNIFTDCYSLTKIDYPNLQSLYNLPPAFTLKDTHYKPYETVVELMVGGQLLTELTIPASATNMDLTRTSGLQKVTIDNTTTRKTHSFALIPTLQELTVGAGEIEVYCRYCSNLKTVNVSTKNRATKLYYYSNAFEGCTSLESISFPNLEGLSYEDFKNCTSLKSVNFPKLKTIGQSAFEGCTALTDVNLPLVETVERRCFKGCTALENISLPEVTQIGDINGNIFEGCISLTTADFPKATVVGSFSFKDCTNLSNFNFDQVMEIKEGAFMGTGFTEVDIPLTCKVGNNAFSSCHNLKRLSMPATLICTVSDLPVAEDLVLYANPDAEIDIYNCFTESTGNIRVIGDVNRFAARVLPGLNRLSVMGNVTQDFYMPINTLPKEFEVRSIEEYLGCKFRNNAFTPGYFADAPDLIDFYINGQLVKDLLIPPGSIIPAYAFNKFNIESVIIGGFKSDAPTTINKASFFKCKNLKKLIVSGNLSYIGDEAFRYTGLETVELPSTLTGMGICTFGDCDDLRHISFPQSLTTFPDGTVFGCQNLESLIIPEGVTYCGYQIASGSWNKELKTVSLPSTVEALSRRNRPSFENFTHSLEFLSWAYVAPAANFDNLTGFTVHVPQGASQNYKNKAAWANAEIIEDLLVGNNVTVDGTDVMVYVPKQTSVSERATVVSYTVDFYAESDTERTEPDFTYEFDTEGQPMSVKSRNVSGEEWHELHITGLPVNSKYAVDIKGRTVTNDVIYSHSQEVTTGIAGIESTEVDNDIHLEMNTLYIPAKYAGKTLTIYSLGGTLMLSAEIGENGSEIALDLESGVYVLRCGDTTLKFKI